MPLVRNDTDETLVPLDAGWEIVVTEPGAVASPAQLCGDLDRVPAPVPGTAEEALIAAGILMPGAPSGLHDKDVWYRCAFSADGASTLRIDGLAGPADIFLDGELRLQSQSMFRGHEIDVAAGRHVLAIRFRALNAILEAAKGPRQRWRPMMIQPGSLRLVRTTPLGHMPGWSPQVAVVGPWQPVALIRHGVGPRVAVERLVARLDDGDGILDISLRLSTPSDVAVEVLCGGHAHRLHPDANGGHAGRMLLPGIAPWWPHTHGEPALHPVALRIGERLVDLGRVGFRRLAVDHGPDGKGFALVINGERIFCRGASWMPPDPVSPGKADPRPLLELARDAGMNMIRLSGTTTPEAQAFHDLCDELGILVWHDLPFANFDYPGDDPAFRAEVEAEAKALLSRLQGSPSLAVICGGSEMAQQATMLGLKPSQASMPLFETMLPAIVADIAPQAAYLPHTPWGGPLPFVTNEGVTHYFGVGAYCRPVEDARRAEVRFASECLAFANVPSPATLAAEGLDQPAGPRWKDGVPRDAGASWDFEDVRDHYVGTLFGVDAQALRSSDPDRYLALGRAAPAELMEAVFAEWRRMESPCGGGLIWFLNDMKAGAGWGVIDRLGMPKTVYHALKRAFRPLHLGITDEGLNGLAVHAVNETAASQRLKLVLATYGDGPHPLARAETEFTLAPRQARSWSSFALTGHFFDVSHAYRFGALAHQATLARLHDLVTGELVAEASHVVAGQAAVPRDIGLTVAPVQHEGAPALSITTSRFARFVTIDDMSFRAADEGFHLAPGETRVVPLVRRTGLSAARGHVAALNSPPVSYEFAA